MLINYFHNHYFTHFAPLPCHGSLVPTDKVSGGGPRALPPARTPSSRRPLQCLVGGPLVLAFSGTKGLLAYSQAKDHLNWQPFSRACQSVELVELAFS